ncbi:MAG: hypothetical protein R3F25_09575 [Gammaproteobacteria bacterium]|jgi:hypothetical protein
MKRLGLIFLSTFLLSDCSYLESSGDVFISPLNAIQLTSESESNSQIGEFQMQVKSIDNFQRMTFLNSELDSKDQRNLTIAIRPRAVQQLTKKYGDKLQEQLLNSEIKVSGEAKRQKIWVLHKNSNTGQYYYQTKVFVKSADQISFL